MGKWSDYCVAICFRRQIKGLLCAQSLNGSGILNTYKQLAMISRL